MLLCVQAIKLLISLIKYILAVGKLNRVFDYIEYNRMRHDGTLYSYSEKLSQHNNIWNNPRYEIKPKQYKCPPQGINLTLKPQ